MVSLIVDLVPHSSIQGTARPAHYCIPFLGLALIIDVIQDDHNLPADFVQRLCYQMSYVYQRSCGAVSLRTFHLSFCSNIQIRQSTMPIWLATVPAHMIPPGTATTIAPDQERCNSVVLPSTSMSPP
jgi:hypothetical protein